MSEQQRRNAVQILLTLDKKIMKRECPCSKILDTRRDYSWWKIATQHGSAGDYKILGGGVEPGEKLEDALIREVGEESGLIVIPESIRPIGEIVERRRDLFEKTRSMSVTPAFFCDAKEEMTQTHMTESEIEKGFHLEWATAQEIIDGNEPFCETQPWSFRDREFVKMLVEKRFSPHSFYKQFT